MISAAAEFSDLIKPETMQKLTSLLQSHHFGLILQVKDATNISHSEKTIKLDQQMRAIKHTLKATHHFT